MTIHLKSSVKSEIRPQLGYFLHWTECGIEAPSCDVDNDEANATCRRCLAYDRRLKWDAAHPWPKDLAPVGNPGRPE